MQKGERGPKQTNKSVLLPGAGGVYLENIQPSNLSQLPLSAPCPGSALLPSGHAMGQEFSQERNPLHKAMLPHFPMGKPRKELLRGSGCDVWPVQYDLSVSQRFPGIQTLAYIHMAGDPPCPHGCTPQHLGEEICPMSAVSLELCSSEQCSGTEQPLEPSFECYGKVYRHTEDKHSSGGRSGNPRTEHREGEAMGQYVPKTPWSQTPKPGLVSCPCYLRKAVVLLKRMAEVT